MTDIKIDVADKVALVTIDRPPVNALLLATYRETLGLPAHTVHSSELAVAV